MSDDIISSGFDTLSNSLGVEYEEDVHVDDMVEAEEFKSEIDDDELRDKCDVAISNIETEVQTIEDKKVSLQTQLTSAKIRDVEFLTTEIKSLILSSKGVLRTLESEIKVGAQARMYEVYGGLLNSITAQYKELRQLNESVAKFIIENKKQNLEEVKVDQKMTLTSADLNKMVAEAQENNSLDAIDATFEIEDE